MPSVLAIAAHPDDIEFTMAGTLILLARQGWTIHYFNLADGRCGSAESDAEQTAVVRLREAQAAAAALGATFHPPICRDLEIQYDTATLRKVAAVVRLARPQIVLTHSPVDYMEDHEQACRLAVSATFVRGMKNFETAPNEKIYDGPVTIYHTQPHGNRTPLGELVVPNRFVDITDVIDEKQAALASHASQQHWLSDSQGLNSYLQTMRDLSAEVGALSGKFSFAEGWRRHHHLGFSPTSADPLNDALSGRTIVRVSGNRIPKN